MKNNCDIIRDLLPQYVDGYAVRKAPNWWRST